mgnify:CR=1 FL=1|jgi:hypothetical protein
MLEYICISIILLFLIPIIYVRIRYPFWSTQPVFHTYDIFRYLARTPYEIHQSVYSKMHKIDPNIQTISFLDMTNNKKIELVQFIQDHLVESDNVLTLIDQDNLHNILTGQFYPSYVSFYDNTKYSIVNGDNGEVSIQNTPQIIGCITSRGINMFILDKSDKIHEKNGYLWDYICTHRDHTKYNIGRKLIQSHDIYQRTHTKDISISLFKKENQLCEGVIPLTKYKVFSFIMSKIRKPKIPTPYSVDRIYNDNVDILYDYLYNITHNITNLRFIAFPDIANLDILIKSNKIIIYILKRGEVLCGIYIFKDPMMCYDNIGEQSNVLECSECLYVQDVQPVFFAGFLHALYHIQKSFASKYKIITFHNLGHNYYIIERWKWKYVPLSVNDAAYYLYNAVIPNMPIGQSECLIIT